MAAMIAVILMMIGLSFYCSISEAVLYAVPPELVEKLRQQGSSSGLRLGSLRHRIERPITAILFFNTLATTMGAALAGALFADRFSHQNFLPFSIGLTLLILVFGEIVPKTLGVGYARRLAAVLAWPLQILVWVSFPFVRLGEWLARLFLPRRGPEGPSEDEILALASLGVRGGTILPEEAHWIRHILLLNDKTAGGLMTPRPVLTTLLGSRTIGEIEKEIPSLEHSRIPVITAEGSDHVIGVVLRRRLVNALMQGQRDVPVLEFAQPATFVPSSMRGHQLLTTFIEKKKHLAVVVDEYGGTMGVVTLEDVIEAMLGTQIIGELDRHPDMRAYARSRAKSKLK